MKGVVRSLVEPRKGVWEGGDNGRSKGRQGGVPLPLYDIDTEYVAFYLSKTNVGDSAHTKEMWSLLLGMSTLVCFHLFRTNILLCCYMALIECCTS